jgi:hypothetical protein
MSVDVPVYLMQELCEPPRGFEKQQYRERFSMLCVVGLRKVYGKGPENNQAKPGQSGSKNWHFTA